MEDDLGRLKEADWIIEVVVERVDVKRSVFEKLENVMTRNHHQFQYLRDLSSGHVRRPLRRFSKALRHHPLL